MPGMPPSRVILDAGDPISVTPQLHGIMWNRNPPYAGLPHAEYVSGAPSRVELQYDDPVDPGSMVMEIAKCPDPVYGVVWADASAALKRRLRKITQEDIVRYNESECVTVTGGRAPKEGCFPVDSTVWCPGGGQTYRKQHPRPEEQKAPAKGR